MEVTTDATLDPSVTYNYYDSLNNLNITPSVVIIIIVVLVVFIAIFSSLGTSWEGSSDGTGNNEYQQGTTFFGVLAGIVFLFIIILGGVDYFYGTTIYASGKNLFTNTPEIDITLDQRTNKDELKDPG